MKNQNLTPFFSSSAKIIFALSALSTMTSLSAQASLQNCTDTEVVAAVCGPTIAQPPVDDTGMGVAFPQFGALRSEYQTSNSTVTDTAYARFLVAFDNVVTGYKALAQGMPEKEDRLFLSVRLELLKPPTREYLNTRFLMGYIEGANGAYNPFTDEISLTPEILNTPNLSMVELEMLISHELGHYQDPDAIYQRNIPLIRPSERASFFSAKYVSCFQENFSEWTSRTPTVEDYADYMASQLAWNYVKDVSGPTQLARVRNVAFVMCQDVSSTAIGRFLQNNQNWGDAHALWSERILTFMRDPRLLEVVGCGSTIVRDSTMAEIKTCRLESL